MNNIGSLLASNTELFRKTENEVVELSDMAEELKNEEYAKYFEGGSVVALINVMLCHYIKANCRSWNWGGGEIKMKLYMMDWIEKNQERFGDETMGMLIEPVSSN